MDTVIGTREAHGYALGHHVPELTAASDAKTQRRRWGASSTIQDGNLGTADMRKRRWKNSEPTPPGTSVAQDGANEKLDKHKTLNESLVPASSSSGTAVELSILRALRARANHRSLHVLGVQFAQELFKPRVAALSFDNRRDIASLGQTSYFQTTQKLHRDFARIAEGNAVYWPQCLCLTDDQAIYEALYAELSPWKASPYKRSRHPACVEEAELLSSPTYIHVVAALRRLFGIKVGYSIVNLYADGNDWTDYHRDNYKADGNRMRAVELIGSSDSGPGSPVMPIGPAKPTDSLAKGHEAEAAEAHNVTVGASFGAPRDLRFKHLETSLEFGFPQGNGDVFAFTEPVNSAFQHCIPQKLPAASVGPRISIILWGRTEGDGLETCRNIMRAQQCTP